MYMCPFWKLDFKLQLHLAYLPHFCVFGAIPEAQSQAVNEAIVNAADSADLILTDVDMV